MSVDRSPNEAISTFLVDQHAAEVSQPCQLIVVLQMVGQLIDITPSCDVVRRNGAVIPFPMVVCINPVQVATLVLHTSLSVTHSTSHGNLVNGRDAVSVKNMGAPDALFHAEGSTG
jgi:hypothetical protein